MSNQQRATFRRDAKSMLVQTFVMFPATLLVVAWVIWWAAALLGAPGNDLATGFLGESFSLLIFIQTYVVVAMMVPGILCALSDPVGTRLAMWALGSSLLSLMPQVFFVMQAIGSRGASLPISAPPVGVRYGLRALPSIPTLRFSLGTSPQLE